MTVPDDQLAPNVRSLCNATADISRHHGNGRSIGYARLDHA